MNKTHSLHAHAPHHQSTSIVQQCIAQLLRRGLTAGAASLVLASPAALALDEPPLDEPAAEAGASLDELVVTNRWKGVLRDVHGVRVIGQENQACKWVGHPPEKR